LQTSNVSTLLTTSATLDGNDAPAVVLTDELGVGASLVSSPEESPTAQAGDSPVVRCVGLIRLCRFLADVADFHVMRVVRVIQEVVAVVHVVVGRPFDLMTVDDTTTTHFLLFARKSFCT
jgi:hypothetical protein